MNDAASVTPGTRLLKRSLHGRTRAGDLRRVDAGVVGRGEGLRRKPGEGGVLPADCPAVTEALEGADGASVVMSMSGSATVSARAPLAQATLNDAAIQQIRFMSVLVVPAAIPVKAG